MSIRIQQSDFDIGSEIKNLKAENTNIGAIVSFTGTVRQSSNGQTLTSMTLEHYPEMTEKELRIIESEANDRWPLIDSLIIHRYGELKPGDNIVLVVTMSPHRHAAFEAASFLMDYLKNKAPFWKKEKTVTGDAIWVDARETDEKSLERWQKN